MPRVIVKDFRVDWDLDGSFTNESTRLISANGEMRFAPPENTVTNPRGIVDTAQFVLDNRDGGIRR
jgi:hypothetical protein